MANREGHTKRLKFQYPKYWKLRAAVFKRDKFTCQGCGWQPAVIPDADTYDGRDGLGGWDEANGDRVMDVDHIIPRVRGGTHDLTNLQALCSTCNKLKGARMPEGSNA
jgi:5-methylcytosine-specific restriction endonuclease McrA